MRAGLLCGLGRDAAQFPQSGAGRGHCRRLRQFHCQCAVDLQLGEPIHVYVEVLGYGWQANEDGTQSVVLDVDLALKTAEGKLVASEEKFLSTDIRSLSQNL